MAYQSLAIDGTAYEVPCPAGYEMVQAPDSSRDCPASLLPPGVSPTSSKACGCTLFLGQGSSPGGLGLSSRSKVNFPWVPVEGLQRVDASGLRE